MKSSLTRAKWLCVGLVLAATAGAAEDAARVTPVVLAYRKARPAVVNVASKRLVSVHQGLFGDQALDDIFPLPMMRQVPVQSLGSGVIIHSKGYIVTNDHVVRRAQEITVRLSDDKEYPAKVISTDPRHDLAVLKIDVPNIQALPYLPLGRSDDLMVGETVVAIGNPMGYANSVTTGVVSATNRALEFQRGVKYEGLIQIDAPINPGNSGGPLLNIKGELIGINSAIRADAQNIGFAIPVDLLADDFGNLLDFQRLHRVVFGADVRQRHTETGDELYVAKVTPGTPAAGALQEGDKVLELAGQPVRQAPQFICAMLEMEAGKEIAMKVSRGGKEQALKLTMTARPKPDGKALARQCLGLSLRVLTPELAQSLRLPVSEGLMISGVETDSPAGRMGLQPKDVLVQLGSLYVKDLDAVGAALEDARPGDVMKIGIVRGNVAAWAPIEIRGKSPATGAAPAEGTPL